MAVAMIGPKFYAWDRNGKPLAFGKLYTYQARTNIPKATYQSEDQVVENTNPVILNGEGYANIYLDGSYKMVLKDKDENEIWSSDPVTAAQAQEWVNTFTAEYISPTSFRISGNVTDKYDADRDVRLSNGVDFFYSYITSSVYASGFTTITVNDPVVPVGFFLVSAYITKPNSSGVEITSKNISSYTGITFATIEKMKDAETIGGKTVDWSSLASINAKVSWMGYYDQSDGGSNWGVVKSGTITEDGGSLFQVAPGYYVEANHKRSVSVKKFGCKVNANSDSIGHGTPTGDDDYDQFYKCLTFTVQNGLKCKLVPGNMLIGSTVDVDTLPYGDFKGLHIEGTKVKTGRTYTSQIKGAQGLTNLFTQAFDASLSKQRSITLTGFGVISEDEWQDLTVRAPLRAFDLFSCPQSHFERLHFFGITSGLHTRGCFLSTYKDVTSNRCSEGIFCDGDDGAGGYGFADHCSFKDITNSGWVSTFGLKLRGCKAPTLDRIDGESGHTGPSLVFEGCHNVDFRGGYYESFVGVTPIEVKPITGTDFKELTDFSTSVSIANVHGLTNKAGLVKIFKGCIGVDFKNIRNHRFDADGREDEAGEWLTLSAGSAAQGFANYLQNISIDGAISDSDNVSTITNLTAHSQMFAYNGEVIQRETNRLFYGLTLKRGMTLINVANNTVEKVVDGGTLNVALSITADSTANSRVLTNVSDFTGLYVGTFVSFNGQDRLKVTSFDETEGKIYLGEEITASVSGGALSYTAPTLISMTVTH